MKTYILKPILEKGKENKMIYFPVVVIPNEEDKKELSKTFEVVEVTKAENQKKGS